HAQALGRPAEVELLGHGDEVTEVTKLRHALSLRAFARARSAQTLRGLQTQPGASAALESSNRLPIELELADPVLHVTDHLTELLLVMPVSVREDLEDTLVMAHRHLPDSAGRNALRSLADVPREPFDLYRPGNDHVYRTTTRLRQTGSFAAGGRERCES